MATSVGSGELCRAANITYRQLDHWTRRGWVNALPRVGGIGHAREYPPIEVRVCLLMSAMVHDGYNAAHAAQIARERVTRAYQGRL